MRRAAPSLVRLVGTRVAAFALLAVAVECLLIVQAHYEHTDEVGRHIIERETEGLGLGLRLDAGALTYTLPPDMQRYQDGASGYRARVRTLDGRTLHENCGTECATLFPVQRDPRVTFWLAEYTQAWSMRVTGGKVTAHSVKPLDIEIAILHDNEGVARRELLNTMLESHSLPIGTTLLICLLATLITIARALRPVAEAADHIARLGPGSAQNLSYAGLPREVAVLLGAVRDAFERQEQAMTSQKLFTSALSHEIKTPLAVVRLELEQIDHQRARTAEAQIETLNRLVEQLTQLARLEGQPDLPQMINPLMLAEEVVSTLAPLVYESGRSISLNDHGGCAFMGHPLLVENALRNLIENAIRHSGAAAKIDVSIGPGAVLTVSDDGGQPLAERSADLPLEQGGESSRLGLRIVRRIAEICGAAFEMARPSSGGVVARLRFAEA